MPAALRAIGEKLFANAPLTEAEQQALKELYAGQDEAVDGAAGAGYDGEKERVIMRTEDEEYQDLLKMAKMICSVQGGNPEKVAQDIMKKRKREREQGEEFPNKP